MRPGRMCRSLVIRRRRPGESSTASDAQDEMPKGLPLRSLSA